MFNIESICGVATARGHADIRDIMSEEVYYRENAR